MAQRSIKATMTNGSRNRFNDTLTKATLKILFWQKNGLESVPTGVISPAINLPTRPLTSIMSKSS